MSLGLAELGVAMVEQPVHADEDHVLADLNIRCPFAPTSRVTPVRGSTRSKLAMNL